ncbi:hypothetical protein Taro_012149, partial [Colocasia esculenta]|nr:hypothetical protein [Colocasia esculenta]
MVYSSSSYTSEAQTEWGMMGRDPKRRGVRPYNRSDAPRMRWTEELHARFVDAVRSLGGHHKATPKRILQLMSVKGVSISHI